MEKFEISCSAVDTPRKHDDGCHSKAKENKFNIFLLIVFYTLQFIPIGLALALPIIVQNMHLTSFKDQAVLSIMLYPFALKVLWAPIVDSLFLRKMGRRKSWLIPVQYFLGLFFIITGFHINGWLTNAEKPHIYTLTVVIFILNFLAATQDIVVDGWALTMLKRENIKYAATCNSAGNSFGKFFGFIFPITLTSESFCNKWLRISPVGIITLQGHLYFWGVMYIIVTTLVLIFVYEKNDATNFDTVNFKVKETYMMIFKLLKLPNVQKLIIILVSFSICFSSVDSSFKLKLIDGGITKDEIGAIETLFIILNIFLPLLYDKIVSTKKPMISWLKLMVFRLIISVFIVAIVYITPFIIVQHGEFSTTYKIILTAVYILHDFILMLMEFTISNFFANISDPLIGGTNMTFLYTINNFGKKASQTVSMWLIDFLTFKRCSINHCLNESSTEICDPAGKTCQIFIDGFYIEVCVCIVYGVIWYWVFKKQIYNLQSTNVTEWHVELKK